MIKYEDLLEKEVDWKVIKQVAKRGHLQYNEYSENKEWFLLSYYIAVINRLEEYECRSFASELALFLTGEMFLSGVELVYREERIDNHLQGVFEQLGLMYPKDSKEFWVTFKNYMLTFYKSGESWEFERSTYKLNVNLNENELALLNSISDKSYRGAVRKLLRKYELFAGANSTKGILIKECPRKEENKTRKIT